jgi:hypothetical protein
VCLLHRLAESIWLCKLDQINVDPKIKWYWLPLKKNGQQNVQSIKSMTEPTETRSVKIGKGVWHERNFSPIIRNLYSKYVIKEAFEGLQAMKQEDK